MIEDDETLESLERASLLPRPCECCGALAILAVNADGVLVCADCRDGATLHRTA